ncbi:MAG TPA: DsbA family protein [Terriglobia bacterium]|nr:DsbA family protein [Terriglobia bacterium]
MKVRRTHYLINLGAFAVVVGAAALIGGATRLHARAAVDAPVSTDRVIQFIREQWGIPGTVKVTIQPFHSSTFPGFDESTVTTDDGKQPKTTPVYVTKGGHYLAVGAPLMALGSDFRADIVKDIRETYKVPPATTLTVGPLVKSKYLDFNQTTVTVDDGKNPKQTPLFYVTRDNKVAMLSDSLFNLNVDLLGKREKVLHAINLHNQPSVGPADAPVTIVEYADLQCPSCARFHAFLENELLPRYGDKVRIVFKEFPWPFHDWSKTAAIANECAYQIAPSSFVTLRSMIFSHQGGINVANVRDAMLQYGEEVGIDRLKLAACIDSQASLPRVDEGKREGTAVGVNSTPTSFINGRIVTTVLPSEQFFALVDEALAKH